jgi:class 3 adenylate cyclase/tetratricopeptide (TPR) repeat protein
MGSAGLVALLFTDLVGSTETLARLGEPAAEELREVHFALVRDAVAAHSGTEVKNLGDGFMVAFAAASDAVACAVAIQQAIDVHNRRGGETLGLRAGIAVGEATVEDGDYFGFPVVEASRLCSAAGAGRILVTDMTRMLAGSRTGHDFVPQGPMQLKGLPHPVAVHEVRWEPVSGGEFPLPTRLVADHTVDFIGRTAERETLAQAWKRAREGNPAMVLLAGEPGIGKTRLATEAALTAHEQGGLVLLGTCDEDLAVPYQPFVEAIRHLVAVLPPDDVAAMAGPYAADVARLVPELADRIPQLPATPGRDPETERYVLFSAVAGLLAAVSRRAPVLLVLDDLHWATKPTLLMLRHVVRSAESGAMLMVGTYRDSDVGRGHPLTDLLADLRREPSVERIALRGWSDAETVAFLEALAGHELADHDLGFARAVYAETDGSPFFTRELLRHLIDAGEVIRKDDRWTYTGDLSTASIPDSVREVLGRRLSRLPDAVDRLLTLGSVIGREFDSAVVAAVAGRSNAEVVEALEAARTAGLVREVPASPGRFAFVHALIRHTLYEELGLARRMELHRCVGIALEALPGTTREHLAELAHHWLSATPAVGVDAGDAMKAVGYAEDAGHRAMASLAYEEAIAHFDGALRALRLTDDPLRRCHLLIDRGEAQRCAGDPAHRATLLEAGRLALELGDVGGEARAALANQRGLFSQVGMVDDQRVAALEAVLQAVEPGPSAVRARLLALLATELHFADDDRRLAFAREAVDIARRVDDPATLADALGALWVANWRPEAAAQRAQLAMEMTNIARRLGDRGLEFQAAAAAFLSASESGDMTSADSALAICIGLAEELDQPVLRWRANYLKGNRAWSSGRLGEVEGICEETLRLGERCGQPDHLGHAFGPLGALRVLQGRPEEAAELWSTVLDQLPGTAAYRTSLAWALADAGRVDEARTIVAEYASPSFAAIHDDYLRLWSLCVLARACVRLDEAVWAEDLYDLLAPNHAALVVAQTAWLGPVSHDLGLLATALRRYDDADGHFARAVEVQERLGAHGTLVHTRLEWARMLLRRGRADDRHRARTLLEAGRDGARGSGLPIIERRIEALLATLAV